MLTLFLELGSQFLPFKSFGQAPESNEVLYTERKNGVILTLKVESLAEIKFDPGFRVIGEYLSQIDSILRVNSN